jgi:hypothetical protein
MPGARRGLFLGWPDMRKNPAAEVSTMTFLKEIECHPAIADMIGDIYTPELHNQMRERLLIAGVIDVETEIRRVMADDAVFSEISRRAKILRSN